MHDTASADNFETSVLSDGAATVNDVLDDTVNVVDDTVEGVAVVSVRFILFSFD